jgi:hypothetical protein
MYSMPPQRRRGTRRSGTDPGPASIAGLAASRVKAAVACAGLMAFLLAAPCPAQITGDTTSRSARDSVRLPERARQGVPAAVEDSTRPPLSPGRAFLSSFLLPGLGQARLERHMAGTLYFAVEAVSVAMLAKSANDLRVAKAHENDAVVNRYQTDASGAPIVGDDGMPIPQDTVRSRFNSERVAARATHVEDWIAILVFNHLFAGLDALVSSLLWDVPIRVGVRPGPEGRGAALGFKVRW